MGRGVTKTDFLVNCSDGIKKLLFINQMIKYENKDADRDDGDDDDNDSNVWEFLVIEKLLSINGQL